MKYTYGMNGVYAQNRKEVINKLPDDAEVLSTRPTYLIVETETMWDEMRERFKDLASITKWKKVKEVPNAITA